MKENKCLILTIMIICILFGLFNNISYAENEDTINNIDIKVKINDNGSAEITEIWDMETYGLDQMTKTYYNLGLMEINSLAVVDDNKNVYEFVSNWDDSFTREEKANKCGIFTNVSEGETNLCWGIAKDGNHKYAIKYTIENYVEQSTGYQFSNFIFLDKEIGILPKKAKITVESDSDFNEENINYEGYGFKGEIEIRDGKIVFDATQGLEEDDFMRVDIEFKKDAFSLDENNKSSDAYQDDGILAKPSNNLKENWVAIIIAFIIVIAICVGFAIYFLKKKNVLTKK